MAINDSGEFNFRGLYNRVARDLPPLAHLVEVGVSVGNSTRFLYDALAATGKAFRLDVVGLWTWTPRFEEIVRGKDLLAEFSHTMAGRPVRTVQLPSAGAAMEYENGALDFVFIDADHNFSIVTEHLRAWLPKVKWGGIIAGHGWSIAAVQLAVRDFLPLFDLEVIPPDQGSGSEQSCWLWRKIPTPACRYLREPEAGSLVYVPHVAGEDTLAEALASVSHLKANTVVVDQSERGVPLAVWDGPLARWAGGRHFSRVMNWISMDASSRGHLHFLFMHSDAVAGPGIVEELLSTARLLDGLRYQTWGAIFTHYDALACFTTSNLTTVGCWDESFSWYVADVDYYNRLEWGRRQTCSHPGKVHHRGSSTLPRLSDPERAKAHQDHSWAIDHYIHKWGCHWKEGDGRRWATPYDGRL
jgi:Methyltransferase domain